MRVQAGPRWGLLASVVLGAVIWSGCGTGNNGGGASQTAPDNREIAETWIENNTPYSFSNHCKFDGITGGPSDGYFCSAGSGSACYHVFIDNSTAVDTYKGFEFCPR